MEFLILGKTYYGLHDFINAKQVWTTALQIDPSNEAMNAKLLYNRGLANYRLKLYSEAVTDLTNALKINEKHVKAILFCGHCYFDQRMYQKALYYYEQAFILTNDDEVLNAVASADDMLSLWKTDDYFVLGVNAPTTVEEVVSAYKKIVLVHHPDKHPDASEDVMRSHEDIFKRISVAKENLVRRLN